MSGVLMGRQHHTLDMELFGPNSWLTGFYLAALAAAVEMAGTLGDSEAAERYKALFEKGRMYVNSELWDERFGYYIQKLDLRDPTSLDPYPGGGALTGGNDTVATGARDVYWNDETGEIKYQFGGGCAIDQIIAQWHANICGLKERIFDKDKTERALEAIYRNNFLPNLREHTNPCRLYAVNDEAGAVICAWPPGSERPAIAAPYAEETWSGCEYQVAAHMIQEGLVDEGLRLVRAVRDRYDGEKRNPWNEFECGSNYARSMASYSLLLAYSGFSFDLTRGKIGFAPVLCAKASSKMHDGGDGVGNFGNKNGGRCVCRDHPGADAPPLLGGEFSRDVPGAGDSGAGKSVVPGVFRCFWSLDGAWGSFELNVEQGGDGVIAKCGGVARLTVCSGSINIKEFEVSLGGGRVARWNGDIVLTGAISNGGNGSGDGGRDCLELQIS